MARDGVLDDVEGQNVVEALAARGGLLLKDGTTTDATTRKRRKKRHERARSTAPRTPSGGCTVTLRALDLYAGAGGATRGLMQAGFHVVGVDLEPQPNYCGDAFVRTDALGYLETADLGRFGFIWASPPCQRHVAEAFLSQAQPKRFTRLAEETALLGGQATQ